MNQCLRNLALSEVEQFVIVTCRRKAVLHSRCSYADCPEPCSVDHDSIIRIRFIMLYVPLLMVCYQVIASRSLLALTVWSIGNICDRMHQHILGSENTEIYRPNRGMAS